MSVTGATGFIDRIWSGNLVPVTLELIRLMPEGLVIGTGLFGLICLSFPHVIMFASMIEASLILRLIQNTASYLRMVDGTAAPSSVTNTCRSGFTTPDFSSLVLFAANPSRYPFPSYPVFMLATACSYIFSTLNTLSPELTSLGSTYSSRYYLSLICLSLLLLVFITFRFMYSCDGIGTLLFSSFLGLFLGVLLVLQNNNLFGRESINLVGVPLLKNRAANGQPLYVCNKGSR